MEFEKDKEQYRMRIYGNMQLASELPFCRSRSFTLFMILAVFIGRVPRYYLFAEFQRVFKIPRSILIGSILLVAALALGKLLLRRRAEKRAGRHRSIEECVRQSRDCSVTWDHLVMEGPE